MMEPRGHASETGVDSRPDVQATPPADTRPRPSRTEAEPGAGRTDRPRYFEAAVIAVEDAYRDQQFDPGLMLQRAQALATLAAVEQARIGNLIAWKQLRQTQPATALSGAGDAITAEIEAALGITDPAAGGDA